MPAWGSPVSGLVRSAKIRQESGQEVEMRGGSAENEGTFWNDSGQNAQGQGNFCFPDHAGQWLSITTGSKTPEETLFAS